MIIQYIHQKLANKLKLTDRSTAIRERQTTIRDYAVNNLGGTGTWQYPLTNSNELQLELFGNSGTNTNQACVQATDANGNLPDWICSSPFSVTAEEHSYYSFGGKFVAMRVNGGTEQYVASDQVSSTSLVTSSTGTLVSQTRYTPYGQVRWNNQGNIDTDKSFTSQRDDGMGLMDYKARYYDSSLGRFISPDSIIPDPGNPQAWDRYNYSNNNPINYSDPSGHRVDDGCTTTGCDATQGEIYRDYVYNVIYGGVDRQGNAEKVETVVTGLASLNPVADVYLSLEDGVQWYDVAGVLIPGSIDSFGDDLFEFATKNGAIELAEKSGGKAFSTFSEQTHHILTNKHASKWTKEFSDVVDKYGLKLDEAWNKVTIPHQGRLADKYHQWVNTMLGQVDTAASGNKEKFLQYFNELIVTPLKENPDMLTKAFWQ